MSLDTHSAPDPVRHDADAGRIVLSGRVGVVDLPDLRKAIEAGAWEVDLSEAETIDTSIAWALVTRDDLALGQANDTVEATLDTVREALPEPTDEPEPSLGLAHYLGDLGEAVAGAGAEFARFAGLLGLFLARLGRAFIRPREFRGTALVHHCETVGLKAVPIVALMAFLIGVVLAFQGAAQLQQFGAEIFVVELIAISILRELGVLLTAIIVAGRTASAYCAAIGSMKMREEIDAMQILGIDPGAALIVPRVLALVITLPILTLIADIAGLAGGLLMSWIELGISPRLWINRLSEGVSITHAWIGLVKAPVFAVVIGVIGCRAGLRVESTSESLGRNTSAAVVAAIFAVIVIDAAFSIFFAEMGL